MDIKRGFPLLRGAAPFFGEKNMRVCPHSRYINRYTEQRCSRQDFSDHDAECPKASDERHRSFTQTE